MQGMLRRHCTHSTSDPLPAQGLVPALQTNALGLLNDPGNSAQLELETAGEGLLAAER